MAVLKYIVLAIYPRHWRVVDEGKGEWPGKDI